MPNMERKKTTTQTQTRRSSRGNAQVPTLGERLSKRRRERGESQTEAEAIIGSGQGTVSRWEQDRLPAPGQPELLDALRDYLGMEQGDFNDCFMYTYRLGLPKRER